VIVTITLNPALHVQYRAQRLALRADNQISQVSHRAGGQGLAVARVLHAFGHEVLAAGLAGGATGELIRTDLARSGVPTRFTAIGRESRRVIEVTDAAGGTTSFTEPAPFITTEEVGRLAADYRALLGGAVAVVLSGSLPAGLPPEVYGTLATYAADAGVPAVIDAAGTALRYGVSRRPALVIPGEAAAAVPAGDLVAAASMPAGGDGPAAVLDGAGPARGPAGLDAAGLVADGVGAVVTVTAGEVRAVTAEGEWRAAPAGDPTRPGSREALVAGLIPGLVLGWSWPDRLRHAVALAAATERSGEADLEAYERLLPAVRVTPP
jgi:tagatose 6-phosphate kinase